MRTESKLWSPSRWGSGKIRLYTMHIKKTAVREACEFIGPYEGRLLGAAILSWFDEQKSVEELRKRNVRLIGDEGAVCHRTMS
jgi:hypothetical protein